MKLFILQFAMFNSTNKFYGDKIYICITLSTYKRLLIFLRIIDNTKKTTTYKYNMGYVDMGG